MNYLFIHHRKNPVAKTLFIFERVFLNATILIISTVNVEVIFNEFYYLKYLVMYIQTIWIENSSQLLILPER